MPTIIHGYYMVTVVPRYGMDQLHNYTLIELANEQITFGTISGVARAGSLVGHKYGKWSLVALSLTTPQINTAESQSLAYNLDYFCPILIELKG